MGVVLSIDIQSTGDVAAIRATAGALNDLAKEMSQASAAANTLSQSGSTAATGVNAAAGASRTAASSFSATAGTAQNLGQALATIPGPAGQAGQAMSQAAGAASNMGLAAMALGAGPVVAGILGIGVAAASIIGHFEAATAASNAAADRMVADAQRAQQAWWAAQAAYSTGWMPGTSPSNLNSNLPVVPGAPSFSSSEAGWHAGRVAWLNTPEPTIPTITTTRSWRPTDVFGSLQPPRFRASGGPVSAGESYVVGERGMEMFTPRQDGYITPNNQLGSALAGGGGGVTVIAPVSVMVNTTQMVNGPSIGDDVVARIQQAVRQGRLSNTVLPGARR